MLQCVEGVGPLTSKRILERIPVEDLASMEIFGLDEELRQVKGMSRKSRHLITQVFRGGEVEEQ
jgi:ERCC4-type nuclease